MVKLRQALPTARESPVRHDANCIRKYISVSLKDVRAYAGKLN